MYDTQDIMGDEDLEQFAAMMGIPSALARQMMMEEIFGLYYQIYLI